MRSAARAADRRWRSTWPARSGGPPRRARARPDAPRRPPPDAADQDRRGRAGLPRRGGRRLPGGAGRAERVRRAAGAAGRGPRGRGRLGDVPHPASDLLGDPAAARGARSPGRRDAGGRRDGVPGGLPQPARRSLPARRSPAAPRWGRRWGSWPAAASARSASRCWRSSGGLLGVVRDVRPGQQRRWRPGCRRHRAGRGGGGRVLQRDPELRPAAVRRLAALGLLVDARPAQHRRLVRRADRAAVRRGLVRRHPDAPARARRDGGG